MPPGLVFGPCSAAPPRSKRTKTEKRKAWYWSQSEQKRKVLSKAGSERQRKAKLPERKKKREDLSRKKKREDLLKTRKERREEEKQRKKDAGEPLVTKKNAKNLKSHHGAEQVDATILRLLGRSHKSCKKVAPKIKKMAPKSKNSDRKVEEVAGPKWRHGMREERRESWSARAQLRKKIPSAKYLVKAKAAVSGQIVICSEKKTFKPFSREDETQTEEQKQVKAVHEVPIVDIGPDSEAEGRHCSSGDGAEDMVWPLPIQAPLEPMPPCMDFYQVRIKRTIWYSILPSFQLSVKNLPCAFSPSSLHHN